MDYMTNRFFFRILLLGTALLIAGCASRKEVIQFQEDTAQLRLQAMSIRKENEDMKKILKELNQTLTLLREENRKNRADYLSEMSNLKTEIQIVQAKLEDTNYRLSRYLQGTGQKKIQTDTASGEPANRDLESVQLYDTAFLDLSKSNYDLALQGFRAFLKSYPDNGLANHAQYWIGEIYYIQDNYEKACEEFQKVISEYKQGEKVSSALLKISSCLYHMNDLEGARKNLNLIIKYYPLSDEAKIARTRLQSL